MFKVIHVLESFYFSTYYAFFARITSEQHTWLAVSAGLSVHMIELENRWTDFDAIWYGRYATGVYPTIEVMCFPLSTIPTWWSI
jgi:hypothetical protein